MCLAGGAGGTREFVPGAATDPMPKGCRGPKHVAAHLSAMVKAELPEFQIPECLSGHCGKARCLPAFRLSSRHERLADCAPKGGFAGLHVRMGIERSTYSRLDTDTWNGPRDGLLAAMPWPRSSRSSRWRTNIRGRAKGNRLVRHRSARYA